MLAGVSIGDLYMPLIYSIPSDSLKAAGYQTNLEYYYEVNYYNTRKDHSHRGFSVNLSKSVGN